MGLVDSHCHLPSLAQKEDLEKILNDARQAGVEGFVTVGTSILSNTQSLELAKSYPAVFATASIYPHEDMDKSLSELEFYLRSFLKENRSNIVALGECGIDLPTNPLPKNPSNNFLNCKEDKRLRSLTDQIALFKMQASLAQEFDLPLVIHNRNGDEYILSVLEELGIKKGVLHCFSSSWDFASKILDLGLYISFSGFITYSSKKNLLETVAKVSSNRFLIETDSPFIPPKGSKAKRNEPKYVKLVAEKVALTRNLSFEKTAVLSTENARRLFGF